MMDNKKMCAIYTALWSIYEAQTLLGLASIGKYILLFLIAFSLYKTIYVITHYRLEKFMKGLTLLLLMSVVYGVWYYFFGETYYMAGFLGSYAYDKSLYLKYLFMNLPTVYVYYDYAKKNVFDEKSLFYYALYFIISSIVMYFNYMFTMSLVADIEEGLTNNMGYKFIPLIPLCLLFHKQRMIFVFICFIFILLGMKRGAIIIGAIYILFFLRMQLKSSVTGNKLSTYLKVGALLFAMSFVLLNQMATNSYMQKRLETTMEGNASGRDEMYPILIDNYINNTTTIEFLFGKGSNATIGILGNVAHNDWLEYATNQGALGVLIFLMFFIFWYKDWRKMTSIGVNTNIIAAFGLLLLGSLLTTFFSMMSFMPASAICIGYSLAYYSKRKYNVAIKSRL